MSPAEPPQGTPFSERSAAALAAGRRLIADGRFEEAALRLLEAASANPSDPEILFEIGCAEEGRKRWEEASRYFARAVALAPDWAKARTRWGALLFRLGNSEEALAQTKAALRLDPQSAEAHRLHGAVFYRRRRFAEAAAAFKTWAKAAPKEAEALFSEGRALLMTGERKAAANAFRRAAERDFGLLRAHLFLARMALAEKKLAKAERHLKDALQCRPQRAILLALLAKVLLRRSRLQAAGSRARAALALDPGCDTAALVVAELHIVDGEWAKALPILSTLAEKRPDWAELRALDARFPEVSPRQAASAGAARIRAAEPRLPQTPLPAPQEQRPFAFEKADFAIVSPGPGLGVAAIEAPSPYRAGDILDQLFLLRALILRQLRLHYRETRVGFLLEYVRPLVVMILHTIVFTALNKRMPAKIPVELFVIGSFTIWFACVHVIRGTMHARTKATGVPGVTETHLDIARTVWEFLSMFSLCIACVYLLKIFGFPVPFPNIPQTVLYFILAVLLGLGFGLIFRALSRRFPSTEALHKNFIWILYLTSGHYYSIAYGRHGLADYLWWNPLLHLSEMERRALYPGYPTELVTLWYPAVMAAGFIIFGLLLDKWTRHLAHD